ncbi:MAG: TIGR04282 family arsenosugar biosynthesis glycosyltransferase [Burkholderiaceae bacterium]|nr:TIGR04282 family arsenosugar biosynthesis glycosyltransferase [Aquabacterium sp.]NUP85432.1 TIGR04282 family arsenosugar biosynthesis glycosyltransferase [Burkholderiaceae bacterium]
MATGHGETTGDFAHVQVAVLAKAPIAGLAKTRLIPALGAAGAARLQRRLTRQAILTAQAAGLGPVTLWCTPDARHRFFRALNEASGVPCLVQASGDLGDRMHTAFRLHCTLGPLLLIGTDCPPLTPAHLRRAARALCTGLDAVFHPAEDGGYAMVGLRAPQATLFTGMRWSTDAVMADTRARARDAGLTWCELETLWDLDEPADLARLSPAQSVALGLAR